MTERTRLLVSPEAWEQLYAEAKDIGFGQYMFGSVYADGNRPDRMTIHFNTLVAAAYYAKDEALAASPVLFARNADNDILLPGRWWQDLVASSILVDTMSNDVVQDIRQDIASSDMVNAIVPKSTPRLQRGADDTLLVSLPDLLGRHVVQEVLLPGTEAFVPFPPKWLDLLKGGGAA